MNWTSKATIFYLTASKSRQKRYYLAGFADTVSALQTVYWSFHKWAND
ncbi:hypothetical protein [Larkinella terrae]|uniref:Uncharacterized protein n=1 Tax=Larkinella terrae TaxID=2025311 RepID=A0A7K0ENA9_9BACT|nr:hypothetical protein [Larkinella terrae]MRS63031.1 hypothetical protein [Larkinella terrae]